MSPKTTKILYWIITGLFVAFSLFSVYGELFATQSSIDAMAGLGYPANILLILGIAKLLGSIALLQNKNTIIKEWAYAGFTFDLIGAYAAISYVGAPLMMRMFPLIVLVVLIASYKLWKRMEQMQ